MALALQLDTHDSKTTILSMHLAVLYFGHGPPHQRGEFWLFRRRAGTVDRAQAALLATVVQAPSALDPVTHLAAATQRIGYVLQRLVSDGKLTSAQAAEVARSPLQLAGHGPGHVSSAS